MNLLYKIILYSLNNKRICYQLLFASLIYYLSLFTIKSEDLQVCIKQTNGYCLFVASHDFNYLIFSFVDNKSYSKITPCNKVYKKVVM